MKGFDEKLRDGLLSEDKVALNSRTAYNEELRMLLEDRITPLRRLGIVFIAILIGVQMFYFGYKAVLPGSADTFVRIVFGTVALLSGFISGYLLYLVKKKKISTKIHPLVFIRVFFAFALVFMLIVLLGSRIVARQNIDAAIFIAMCGFFTMLIATIGLVYYQIKQSEIKTYEKLLEMELRIIELSEK